MCACVNACQSVRSCYLSSGSSSTDGRCFTISTSAVFFFFSSVSAGCPRCRQHVVGGLKHALVLVRFRFWKRESETPTSSACGFLQNLSLPFREIKCKHCSCTNTIGYSVLRRTTIRLQSCKMEFFSLLPPLLNTEVTGVCRLNALRSIYVLPKKFQNQKSGHPFMRINRCPTHNYEARKLNILKAMLAVTAYILRVQH